MPLPPAASFHLDTIAVGVVLSVTDLAASKIRPEALIAGLKAHPAIAPLVEGAELKEYSAHLIPEGGYDTMPALSTDGMLVAGDAGAILYESNLPGLDIIGLRPVVPAGRRRLRLQLPGAVGPRRV